MQRLTSSKLVNKFAAIVAIFAVGILAGCSGAVKDGAVGINTNTIVTVGILTVTVTLPGTDTTSTLTLNAPPPITVNPPPSTGLNTYFQTSNSNDLVTVVAASFQLGANPSLVIANNGTSANWSEVDFGDTNLAVSHTTTDNVVESQVNYASNRLNMRVYTVPITSTSETDYLVAGIWVYDIDGTDFDEFGAFADGFGIAPVDSTALNTYLADRGSNQVSYSGDANLFLEAGFGGGPNDVFQEQINLTVNFGTGSDSHSIAGGISGVSTGIPIILDSATINPDDWSFESTTSVPPGIGSGFSGMWDGQLYGADASAAAGTFSLSRFLHETYGSFIVQRQE